MTTVAKTKPDTAPDQFQATVFSRSGAQLNLRFDASGQLQSFQQAFQQWTENASSKKPGGDYQVIGWQLASGNWATVAGISYTRTGAPRPMGAFRRIDEVGIQFWAPERSLRNVPLAFRRASLGKPRHRLSQGLKLPVVSLNVRLLSGQAASAACFSHRMHQRMQTIHFKKRGDPANRPAKQAVYNLQTNALEILIST